MLLLTSKTAVIISVAAVLIIQWALAVLALYLLFKDKGIKRNILFWNIFIMFGVIVGPVCYFIVRKKVR